MANLVEQKEIGIGGVGILDWVLVHDTSNQGVGVGKLGLSILLRG